MSKHLRGTGCVFQRRGRGFWILKWSHRGESFSESSRSTDRAVAVKLLKQRQDELARNAVVGPKAERFELGQMIDDMLAARRHSERRSEPTSPVKMLVEFFGARTRVVDISLDRLKRYVAWRRARGLRGKAGARAVANGTINRELATLRYAFAVAVANRRISRDHPPVFKSVMLKEADARQGFVEPAEFARLRDALPEYLRNAVSFLYLTGWRKGAMRTVEWARDLKLEFDAGNVVGGTLTLQAANAKNGRAQRLPLTGDLLEVVRRAWAEREPECPYVFHDRDRPRKPNDARVGAIGNFKSAWSTACAKAGFPNLYVHDLRRSGGRNLIRSGVPESVARQITGHRTRAMFDRYDITSEEDLTNAIERVSDYNQRRATEAPKVVPLRKVV